MNTKMASLIGKKATSLKHCDKILSTIEKKGRVDIVLNNTGVTLPCSRGDALHTLIQSIKYKLVHEINAISIVDASVPVEAPPIRSRAVPAPVGACEGMKKGVCAKCGKEFEYTGRGVRRYCSDDCKDEVRRERNREFMREYNRKKRAEKA